MVEREVNRDVDNGLGAPNWLSELVVVLEQLVVQSIESRVVSICLYARWKSVQACNYECVKIEHFKVRDKKEINNYDFFK